MRACVRVMSVSAVPHAPLHSGNGMRGLVGRDDLDSSFCASTVGHGRIVAGARLCDVPRVKNAFVRSVHTSNLKEPSFHGCALKKETFIARRARHAHALQPYTHRTRGRRETAQRRSRPYILPVARHTIGVRWVKARGRLKEPTPTSAPTAARPRHRRWR